MSRLSSLKKSAQDLKDRASKTTGAAKEKKIKVSGNVAGLLSIDGTVQKEYGQISSGLKEFEKRISEAGTWSAKIAEVGEGIADAIGDLDPEKAASKEAAFTKSFISKVSSNRGVFTGLTKTTDKRFADDKVDVTSSKTMLGEKKLFSRSRKGDGNLATNSRMISSSRVFLDSSSDKVKEHSETEFNTIGTSNIADMCDDVINLVDAMAYYGEGKGLEKVEKASDKVEKALEKLSRSNDTDEAKGEDAAALRRMVALGHAFSDWARNPTAALINHVCTVSRAVLTIGTKSLAQY